MNKKILVLERSKLWFLITQVIIQVKKKLSTSFPSSSISKLAPCELNCDPTDIKLAQAKIQGVSREL